MSCPANDPSVIFAEVVSVEDTTKNPEWPQFDVRVKTVTNVGQGKQRNDETVIQCRGYFASSAENLLVGETVIIKFVPSGDTVKSTGKFFSKNQLLSIKPQNMERPVPEGQPRPSDGLAFNPTPAATEESIF